MLCYYGNLHPMTQPAVLLFLVLALAVQAAALNASAMTALTLQQQSNGAASRPLAQVHHLGRKLVSHIPLPSRILQQHQQQGGQQQAPLPEDASPTQPDADPGGSSSSSSYPSAAPVATGGLDVQQPMPSGDSGPDNDLRLAAEIARQITSSEPAAGGTSGDGSSSSSDDLRGEILQQILPTVTGGMEDSSDLSMAQGRDSSSSSSGNGNGPNDQQQQQTHPTDVDTAAALATDAVYRARDTATAAVNSSYALNMPGMNTSGNASLPGQQQQQQGLGDPPGGFSRGRGQLPEDRAGLTMMGPPEVAPAARSGIEALLDSISHRWQDMRQMGGRSSGYASVSGDIRQAWVDLMRELGQTHPELAMFARLSSLNPLLLRVVARMGLPAAVLPPTNQLLEKQLRDVLGSSSSSSSNSSSGGNSTWEKLVEDASGRPGSSIMLLLRHIIPARQTQLIDPDGTLADHLLVETTADNGDGSGGWEGSGSGWMGPAAAAAGVVGPGGRGVELLSHSLVLQTGLGSYIQVYDLPADPNAYRLQVAADPDSNSTIDPNSTKAEALEAAAELLGSNSTKISNTTSALVERLSYLSFGDIRALSDPFYLGSNRVLVVPINGVLQDNDEVINGRTAAQLRGAFGWKPEDEHALLSRVFLDPESSYWAQTLEIIESRNKSSSELDVSVSQQEGSSMQQQQQQAQQQQQQQRQQAAVASATSADPAVANDSSVQPVGGRKLAQDDTSSGDPDSTGSSAGSGSSSSSSSGNDSNSPSPDASSGSTTDYSLSVTDASNTSGSSSSGASSIASSTAAPQAATATPPGGNGSSSSNVTQPAASVPVVSAGTAATTSSSSSNGTATTPVEIAELLARQQDEVLHIHMADALAANLMTYEALAAWTTAAVSNPTAVFAMSPQRVPGSSSSSSSSVVDPAVPPTSVPCFVDWDAEGTVDFGIGCCDASSSGSSLMSAAQRTAAASNHSSSSLVQFLIGSSRANGSGSSSSNNTSATCQAVWSNTTSAAAAAALRPDSQAGADSLRLSGLGLLGPSGVPGCTKCASAGTISSAALVGATPYQLYPGLGHAQGTAGAAAGSSALKAEEAAAAAEYKRRQQQQPDGSSSSSVPAAPGMQSDTTASSAQNGSSSGNGDEFPGLADNSSVRTLRGLKQTTEAAAMPGNSTAATSAAVPPSGGNTTDQQSAVQVGTSASNAGAPVTHSSSMQGTSAQVQRATGNSNASSSSTGAGSETSDDGIYVRVNADDLAYFSVVQLAELLANGQVTPQQVAAIFHQRLARYDALLHPVVTYTPQLAAQQAEAAKQLLSARNASKQQQPSSSSGGSCSLLAGIPYGLKDLLSVPGYPTSWGLTQLRDRTIDTPSWAFTVLSAAGGVHLAKTATGELAWGDSWFDGITTRNPWNTNKGSCGSSAGSAVAVAAGLLPFAIGTETWGSIVCPASTVGVTAYRPTGGAIPGHGSMQVSPSLDKPGVFCRTVLDCAVVADALMDKAAPNAAAAAAAAVNSSSSDSDLQRQQEKQQALPLRLHRQDANTAAAFNYTQYQDTLSQQQQQQQEALPHPHWDGTLLPPTFQQLPRLSNLCIGYLRGTSDNLVQTLRRLNPACVKGPLRPPGNNHMVQDVLSVILQAEVAVNLQGLWLEGYINQTSHWYPLIQLGQVLPAAAYLKAQRLRAILLVQTRHYFASNGINVLLKPAKSDVGMDGLAALLDMPEILLPVGFTITVSENDAVAGENSSEAAGDPGASYDAGSTSAARLQQQQQQLHGSRVQDMAGPGAPEEQLWLQPDVNSMIALPGADAAVIAVGAAFQSVTDYHQVHPILP